MTMVLALLVAWSDYRWANLYRDFFATLASDGSDLWECLLRRGVGAAHHARAGLAPYEGQRLAPYDCLVYADDNDFGLKGHIREFQTITTVLLRYPGPFAILDNKHQAGFYSQGWGYLPFVPSDDVVDVLIVARPVAGSERPARGPSGSSLSANRRARPG